MRRHIFLIAAVSALFAVVVQAGEFSSLEERMTYSEFKAAGLEKLSDEELKALNDWVRNEMSEQAPAPVAAPAPVDTRGFNSGGIFADTRADGPIVSTIKGEFHGWEKMGDQFVLENGQIWQTTDSSTRLSVKANNPTVRIEPGMMGAWFLRVDGYNTRARVKRIK